MEVDMQAVSWLVILVLMLAIEAVSLGLTTIWFAGGALAAFILAMIGVGLPVQIAVFAAVSLVLLIFTRPAAARWVNRDRIRTNAESLVGETAVVTEEIDNLKNQGQVQVRGQYWSARCDASGNRIPKNTIVRIEKISGVKLIVKEEK